MAVIENDNYIQIKKNEDILRLGIRDEEGNDTGNYLEFNLEDIELPLRYQELLELDKKNYLKLRNQLTIIEKQQEHKGKKLLSSKEEARIKAYNEYYREEIRILNMFLGENGVEKLLNGRAVSWGTLEEIYEILEKDIMPKLKVNAENIKEKIMKKYSNKRDDVIE